MPPPPPATRVQTVVTGPVSPGVVNAQVVLPVLGIALVVPFPLIVNFNSPFTHVI